MVFLYCGYMSSLTGHPRSGHSRRGPIRQGSYRKLDAPPETPCRTRRFEWHMEFPNHFEWVRVRASRSCAMANWWCYLRPYLALPHVPRVIPILFETPSGGCRQFLNRGELECPDFRSKARLVEHYRSYRPFRF